jgi:hypothetical protein
MIDNEEVVMLADHKPMDLCESLTIKEGSRQMRADALLIPEIMKDGRRQIDRINSILALAEPLLGVNRSVGERAYVRRQSDGWLFITKDADDTLYTTLRSRRPGQPRYEWLDLSNGVRAGHLMQEEACGD